MVYFVEFGVLWVYFFLLFVVVCGLNYGYDVVDYGCVDFDCGGVEGLECFVVVVCVVGFGILVDIVLNYVGVVVL